MQHQFSQQYMWFEKLSSALLKVLPIIPADFKLNTWTIYLFKKQNKKTEIKKAIIPEKCNLTRCVCGGQFSAFSDFCIKHDRWWIPHCVAGGHLNQSSLRSFTALTMCPMFASDSRFQFESGHMTPNHNNILIQCSMRSEHSHSAMPDDRSGN